MCCVPFLIYLCIYCVFLLVQDWPLDMTDWSMENVVLFMFGQMEDLSLQTELIEKIYYDEVKYECEIHYLHSLLSRLQKERPDTPINPLYNEWVCCMNNYLPQPDKPSQFYYVDGDRGKTWKESVTSMKKHEGDVKRCVIYMLRVKPTFLHQVLQVCANMNQPVQHLYIWAAGDEEIPREETSQTVLSFTDKAYVELRNCDFSWRSLHPDTRSIQHSTTLGKLELYCCRNMPVELFTALGRMRKLKHLYIGYHNIKTELIQGLNSQVKHLKCLQHFGLTYADIDKRHIVPLLQPLPSCPLRKLYLFSNTLTGAISEVCKNPSESTEPFSD